MIKLLSMVLTMLMLLSVICVAPVSVGAAQVEVAETAAPETLYLNAGVWDQADAEFRAWVWGGSTADKWIYFSDPDGDGIYEAALGGTYTGMKVLRCAPGSTEWTSWNDSGDQTIPSDGKNMLVVNDWSKFSWSTYVAPAPVQPGDASDFYLMGTLTDWATGKNMVYAEDTSIVTTTLDLDAGNYELKIKKDSNWMGVGTLTTTINAGGTVGGTDNVTLAADGGTYTFNFTIATKALAIEYTAPEVEPTEAPATTAAPTEAPETEAPATTQAPTEAPATEAPATTATATDATEAPAAETMTIYFENNWAWPDAKAYYWGSTTGTNPGWPGLDMTYVDTTEAGSMRYSIEVPTDITGLLFNGTGSYGSEQCADITGGWYDGICYYMTYDSATNTKPAGSYEYAPIVTPDPTEAPATTQAPTDAPATEAPATTAAPTEAPATEAPATTQAPTEAPVVPEYITIYFTNNWGWTDVRVHTWGSAFEADTNWPGKTMDLVETNEFGQDIYTAQIPADATTVVFTGTNGSGGLDQSSNTVVKDGYGYYMEWTEELGSHAVEYEYVPTPVPTEAPATTQAPTEAPTDAPVDVEIITVFFQNNWYWSDVKIHIWGSSIADFNTEWPGTEMAYYDNDGTYDYYSFNIPADVEGFQINGIKNDDSGNRDQTPDIKEGFYDSICYYMMWSDGNQVGSDFIDNIFTPVAPPATDDESGEVPIIPSPGLVGSTVTLGGNLGVNFWFELNDEILADENAKVIMNVPNSGTYTEVVVPVTDGLWVDGHYIFTAEVAAKEMTSAIEVQLVATDFETEVYTYTVQDYLVSILADAENYAAEQRLVKALLNYGAASQVYFNYNTDALANDTELMTDADRELTEANNDYYAPVINGEGDSIKYYGASLVLDSETSLKFYFTVDETTLPEDAIPSININGLPGARLEKNGNMWFVKIENIAAHQLGNAYTLSIGNGCTITYSAMSYAYQAQQSSKAALVDVANALSAYFSAVGAYLSE